MKPVLINPEPFGIARNRASALGFFCYGVVVVWSVSLRRFWRLFFAMPGRGLHGSGASGGLQSALLPVYECPGKPVAVRIVMQIVVGRYVGRFSGLSMRRIAQADRGGRSRAPAPWSSACSRGICRVSTPMPLRIFLSIPSFPAWVV